MSDEHQSQALTKQERQPIAISLRGIQLTSFDDLWRFSQMVAKSGLAPKGIQTPEAIFVAVQFGMELGLTPMAALQNIGVINGKPGIYGDAALALCRASGLVVKHSEVASGQGDDFGYTVTTLRKGDEEPVTWRFSIKNAKIAKLWGKQGPWSDYPERMLMWRARGFVLRDAYGDILKGLKTMEELGDTPAIEVETVPQIAPTFTPAKQEEIQASIVLPTLPASTPPPVEPKPTNPAFRVYALLEQTEGVTEELILRVLKRKGFCKDNVQEFIELPNDVLLELEGNWEMISAQARIDAKAAAQTGELSLK